MVAKQPEDLLFASRDQKQVLRSLRSHQDDSAEAGSSGRINKFGTRMGRISRIGRIAPRFLRQAYRHEPKFLGTAARNAPVRLPSGCSKKKCSSGLVPASCLAARGPIRRISFDSPHSRSKRWSRPDHRSAPKLYGGGGGPPRPGRPGPNGGGPPLPRPLPSTSGM